MHDDQRVLVELFRTIRGYEGVRLLGDVLHPWRQTAGHEIERLHSYKLRPADPYPDLTTEDCWQLYAWSRINEWLLLAFQDEREGGATMVPPDITLHEYEEFLTSCGLDICRPDVFHPFYHEIVEVMPSEEEMNEIEVAKILWPCVMLGDMMFSRAGCVVRASSNLIDPVEATTSPMYWAYVRRNRPHEDLSHGWGSNSQWRTCFRRDYRTKSDSLFFFNVDGLSEVTEPDSQDEGPLHTTTINERIERLIHRCTVKTPAVDCSFPYSHYYDGAFYGWPYVIEYAGSH